MAKPCAEGGARFGRLAALLDRDRPVLVQTHDYPDIDAVASAWGLAGLLGRRGFSAECSYRGKIRARSLSRLVAELGLPLLEEPTPFAGTAAGGTGGAAAGGRAAGTDGVGGAARQIVVVDGSPANGNVSLYEGELVGVIDHHCKSAEPEAPFVDLRPELASCSAIVYGYWAGIGEALSRDLATALLAGIQSDTDFLSRRASPEDFAAYAALFGTGDFEKASRIVRTVLDLRELGLVVRALESSELREGLLWACLPGPSGQEVLAVLAEFVLRAEEIRAAVVMERGEGGVHLSVRSKDPALSAFALVRSALEGLGAGGGHSHSAGGFVPDAAFPGEGRLRERFFAGVREIARNR